ncbi:MAG TPA: hypothetical protein VLN90_03485, partial [Thioalkalivibrio sp.]|nr:hypothetical protein [Thioalkalivibrio sp.]
MRKILFSLISFFLAILLLLPAALWWNRDHLAQQVVRPWLVETLQEALQAKVDIAWFQFDWQRLTLRQLDLSRDDGLQLRIAEIEIHYRVADLLRKHLAGIVVRQPHLQLGMASFDQDEKDSPFKFPDQAPLKIDRWSLENGSLLLVLPERQLVVRDLAAQGSLGPDFIYALQAGLGDAAGPSFRVSGGGEWRQGVAVTLSELIWDEQSLLSQAVTLRPGTLPDAGIQFALERLDSAAVGALLVAAGEEIPWPEDLSWQLSAAECAVQFSGDEIRLRLQAQHGSVRSGASLWPWRQLDVRAAGPGDGWQLALKVMPDEDSRLQLDGQWRQQAFIGTAQFTSDQPLSLARQYQLDLPGEIEMLRQVSAQARLRATAGEVEVEDGRISADLNRLGSLQGS